MTTKRFTPGTVVHWDKRGFERGTLAQGWYVRPAASVAGAHMVRAEAGEGDKVYRDRVFMVSEGALREGPKP